MISYPNAKINIGLNVISIRADGYHNLSSVFYPITELYDILEVLPSSVFAFTCSGIPIPECSNICVKAFEILKRDFKIGNVKIHLHKQIPIGAGLGGGSADGAFTLVALNHIFNLNLSDVLLEKYALELGSDCPFFIDNSPKFVEGVGEKMMKIDLDISDYELRFVFPELHISTKCSFTKVVPNVPLYNLLFSIRQPLDTWKNEIKNDFEKTIFLDHPELYDIKKKLYNDGAIYASMSGSGSVIYGIFNK